MFKDHPQAPSQKLKKSQTEEKLAESASSTSVGLNNRIYKRFGEERRCVIENSDCFDLLKKIPDGYVDLTISSPPYCMGKEYESSTKIKDFIAAHEELIPEIYRITSDGGSICWQVGYHVQQSVVTPLDFLCYSIFSKFPDLHLRNRIIWTFGHGLHGNSRFSGRHEVILWFTKGKQFDFNLDSVRVPQKYPGKMHYKGSKKGEPSSNPMGKNPGDVWEIPVVNASHIEKTIHPCQFPHALAQRLVLALSGTDDVIFDPFVGSGTTAAAALTEGRRFVGSEICEDYWQIATDRAKQAMAGSSKFRPHDKPISQPDPATKVAKIPESFNHR